MQTAQTATTPAVASSAPVDVNTLAAALVSLGGLAYGLMKVITNKMKKSENTSINKSASMIEQFVLPALQQNTKFVEKTQNQDVKIEQLAEVLYEFMGKEANNIHDKEEIKQKKLIEDAALAKREKEEYETKVKQVEDLKIKLGLTKPPPPPPVVVAPAAPKPPPPPPPKTKPAAAAPAAAQPSMVWDEATKSWISK